MKWAAMLVTVAASALPRPAGASEAIDHLLLGVSDLEWGIAEFERLTGVRPVIGGSHPGAGTRNALVSLGEGLYLELIAPDPEQASTKPMPERLRALVRPTPIGWAIRTDDVTRTRATLARAGANVDPIVPGSRVTPGGKTLRWETFGIVGRERDSDPFFIHWLDPSLHPAKTSPTGCRLVRLEVGSPNARELRQALSGLRLPVKLRQASTDWMRVSLRCPKGAASFP